ncbi:hypothetical protein, partial [Enterobacter hormaechei]|uniref:hypothetical protein n=1 Tax=Enterobacter hormaechei TaxID=158836 RepID=UPI0039BEE9D8
PAYGPQNDVTLKMPAFEWVHVQLHQQKGMISLSPPTICNSAHPVVTTNEGTNQIGYLPHVLNSAGRKERGVLPLLYLFPTLSLCE